MKQISVTVLDRKALWDLSLDHGEESHEGDFCNMVGSVELESCFNSDALTFFYQALRAASFNPGLTIISPSRRQTTEVKFSGGYGKRVFPTG